MAGLLIIYKDGKVKMAQRMDESPYPEVAGVQVLSFLRSILNRDGGLKRFNAEVADLRLESYSYLRGLNDGFWAGGNGGKHTQTLIDRFPIVKVGLFPEDIFEMIMSGEINFSISDLDLAMDSTMCSWGYFIDLDNNSLGVFRGWNKNRPAKGARFVSSRARTSMGEKYWPIGLVGEWEFSELPDNATFFDVVYRD